MPRRNNGPRLRWLEKRNCFYICWTEGGRSRERSTGATDRKQAEIALGDFIAARQRRAGPRDPDEALVTDALADYAEAHYGRPSFKRVAYATKALVPFWQGCTAADVHEASCRQYAKARGRADGTIRCELKVLQAAINAEAKAGKLTRAPAVWLPASPEPRDEWLTRDEVARLLRAARSLPKARDHLPRAILLAVYTGRRKEAVLGLRWAQVDLDHGRIDFRRPGEAETTKRRGRPIPIHRKLLGHLRRAKRRQGAGDLDFVVAWGRRRVSNISGSFALAVERAGLEKRVTPHTLKHTAASWMIQAGVPLWDVAQYLATSMRTLEQVYAHHRPDQHERALKAFG
jgi:integrase